MQFLIFSNNVNNFVLKDPSGDPRPQGEPLQWCSTSRRPATQRPPKTLNDTSRTSEDTRSSTSGGSLPILDSSITATVAPSGGENGSENTAWYEYGCV